VSLQEHLGLLEAAVAVKARARGRVALARGQIGALSRQRCQKLHCAVCTESREK
jgi:hypothetical protein